MQPRRAVRSTVRRALGLVGRQFAPAPPDYLRRLADAGVAPRTVIDVGAALGDWTRTCGTVFPEARYVLVEPLSEFDAPLQVACRGLDATVVQAAVSACEGTRTLHVHRDLVGSSLLREREGVAVDGKPRDVQVVTADALVSSLELEPPFLLKLDVQGAELEVLEGARSTLADTVAVLTEVSFFDFYFGGATFEDLVIALAGVGFVVYDFAGLSYRPADGALAQADVVFVPRSGVVRTFHGWASPDQREAQDRKFRRTMQRRIAKAGRGE